MKNTQKFNKDQHVSQESRVDGFEEQGIHNVEVAGEGVNPETKEPYSYGVDKDGNPNGSAVIVLVDTATTKTQLKKRMTDLVDYTVTQGTSEEDAVTQVIDNLNHSRNINQRQPLRPTASNATGVREVSKAGKEALAAGVSQISIQEAIAQLTEEANNARMAS